jgi:hypothetical protein
MLRDERGIALLTVIMMTAIMMVIVSLVAYKVLRSTRGSATEGLKTKTYYAASAGIDSARLELSEEYIASDYWKNILDPDTAPGYTGAATNPAADLYMRTTDLEPGNFTANPPLTVRVYIKDNNDGDGNYGIDSDQLVMVNVEASEPNSGTTTMVEARLLYDDTSSGYSQLGGSAGREHFRDVTGVGDPTTLSGSSVTVDLK